MVRSFSRFSGAQTVMKDIIDGTWKPQPSFQPYVGAVMLADISGFTALAERLSNSAGPGFEALSASLNRYFNHMTDMIYQHGGDVIKFAGDAVRSSTNDKKNKNKKKRRKLRLLNFGSACLLRGFF